MIVELVIRGSRYGVVGNGGGNGEIYIGGHD